MSVKDRPQWRCCRRRKRRRSALFARPTAPVPTSLLPCWVQTPLLRVKTHAAPTYRCRPAHRRWRCCRRRKGRRSALFGRSNRAGADQLAALLGPHAVAAREDPRRAGVIDVVGKPADNGRIAIGGKSDRKPCGDSDRAGADQFVALLGPDPVAAREDPCRADGTVVDDPPTMAVLPSAETATDEP